MKKILTVLLVAISLIGYSQKPLKIETYKNIMGSWNTYSEKWDYDEYNYESIDFYISGNTISVGDKNQSRYRIIGSGDKSGSTYNINEILYKNCTDEKGRHCSIIFLYYKKEDYRNIVIIYNNMIFRYYTKEDGGGTYLDNLYP